MPEVSIQLQAQLYLIAAAILLEVIVELLL